METETPRRCLDVRCQRELVPEREWRAMDREQRRAARHTGKATHQARGLCARCLGRARDEGKLDDYPVTLTPGTRVVADWLWLHEAGELDPHDSQTRRIRYAAPRLGMSEAALERALQRHRGQVAA